MQNTKKTRFVYDPEPGHCQGGKEKCCVTCMRKALYARWLRLPKDISESIILFVPKAYRDKCDNFLSREAYLSEISKRAAL